MRSSPPATQSPPAQTPGRSRCGAPRRPRSAAFEADRGSRRRRRAGGHEGLADRLEHHVGGQARRSRPCRRSARAVSRRVRSMATTRMDVARARSGAAAAWPIAGLTAPAVCASSCSQRLAFIAGGTAAVDDRHLLGAEELRLHRRIDRRHAAADHDDAATDRQGREILRLAQGSAIQATASSTPRAVSPSVRPRAFTPRGPCRGTPRRNPASGRRAEVASERLAVLDGRCRRSAG